MKPTKLHLQAIALNSKLRPLSQAAKEYAKTLFDKEVLYTKRGYVWCLCCGHIEKKLKEEIEIDIYSSYLCPQCGQRMVLNSKSRKTINDTKLFILPQAVGDWQVFRVFESRRTNIKGQDTQYSQLEVYRTWIIPQGKEIILSRKYTCSFYRLTWYDSPIDIPRRHRTRNNYYDLFSLSNMYIYPRGRVTKLLKRNGWRKEFFEGTISVAEIAKHLYIPTFEMIAKTQPKLFKMLVSREIYDFPFVHAVKICNRNNYIISNPDVWYDMVKNLHTLGHDTHNPFYVCPADLQAAHEKIIKRIFKHRNRIKREEEYQQALQEESDYKKAKSKYFGITFTDGEVQCKVLQSVAEFIDEGNDMHHCVFTNKYYKNKNSLILSARDNLGQRLETIEINLSNYTILQCRGKHNQPGPFHDRIIQLVNQNMYQIKQIS